ncbi:MAG: hypothetical protein KAS64_10535 [Spirochaetes bacterium]|nr:hypothetical protein [Spirochaetota bacterium]
MEAASINCPQCGAGIEVKNRYSKILVCEYCDTYSALESGNAEIMGKSPKLADLPTYLFLGTEGKILNKTLKAVFSRVIPFHIYVPSFGD